MMEELPATSRFVFTIGHSNHSLEAFLSLIDQNEINVVVDVRSAPYSGYTPHFNQGPFEAALKAHGTKYLFLGDILGGRPEGEQFYDDQGHVQYDRLACSTPFQGGIGRVLEGVKEYRIALFCSEEDPTDCHRRLLIGRILRDREVEVLHIRGDGRVQKEEDVAGEEAFRKTKGQKTLFDLEDPAEWKSTQSVLPRKTPPSSSASCEGPEYDD